MPESDPVRQREFALEVVRKLRAAGHVAYWAGGCVRDQLLGGQPKDYDVATSATPEQVREVFGRRRTLAIGAAFGVISVLGGKRAGQIEVATFRQDLGYSDGRHPDEVAYSTPEMDARRRDFTINGMFYDPLAEAVIDFVGGQVDLERGVIRAIGEPRHRFEEDKLRMLRAVRFTATFGFELEHDTLEAIRSMAEQMTVVSAERIGGELQRMLVHTGRVQAVQLLRTTGLLEPLLPEIASLAAGDEVSHAWQATLDTLGRLSEPTFSLALAALLHRSPVDRAVTRVGHRWRFTNKQTERAQWLLDQYEQVEDACDVPWSRLQRLLIAEGIDELLALHDAVHGGPTAASDYCREQLQLPPDELNPPPLLTGDDLIEHGLRPGKHFRRLLDLARDAQLDNKIETKGQALQLVDQLSSRKSENHKNV